MRYLAGWCVLGLGLFPGSLAFGQAINNQSLNGKFFFRHVSLGTDQQGNLVDPRSLIGAITFDGNGHYTFTGQQVTGTNAAAAQTGSGVYLLDSAGFVSLDSPLRSGAKVNARLGGAPGPVALLGSTTESMDNTFDLLVAIPAPAGAAPVLGGTYSTVSLEFLGGAASAARNSIFSLSPSAGKFADFAVTGHAANLSSGAPVTQQVTGATYAANADGSGSAAFGAASNSALLSGNRTIYASADGNLLLGGSTAAGAHDILIGVKAVSGATNATWNANFWAAGLRFDPSATPPDITDYAGSLAARGAGKVTWTRRLKSLGFGSFDFTGTDTYTLGSTGLGSAGLVRIALGAGGRAVVGSAIDASDPGAFEVYFGVQMIAPGGTGVFLNPQGVTSAASFTPAGSPIAPGEFIALFGTGLARSNQTAVPPYPPSLNGVTVLINNVAAPIYFVIPTQIDCLVPYATQGPTATIVVQNGTNSNTVTVPVAATAPGIFSLDQSGSGEGAVLHADYSLVNTAKPAAPGETVLVFLTGMGAVTPAVADGTAGGSNPPSTITAAPIAVFVAGEKAQVVFSGLAPGYPGLYQLNVTLPPFFGSTGTLPLAIETPNAFHDQVDIAVH